MKININHSLPFLLVLLFTPIFVIAQGQSENNQHPEINNVLVNCETGLVMQHIVIDNALKKTKDGGVLIVIVRLGDGENSSELIQRRIYNMREYIKYRYNSLASEKVIVAEGETVKGNGRIEYYLGGQLSERLLYPKNGYICHSCCGPDERYYPYNFIYERQQKQKQKRKRSS